jgi:hypothetical protein
MKALLLAGLLAVSTLLGVANSHEIPQSVVDFADERVYLIGIKGGASGTGVALSDHLMLTACHVVRSKTDEQVLYGIHRKDTTMLILEVVICDKKSDVAVLRIVGPDRPNVSPVLVADAPRRGAQVYGAGHPMAMQMVITSGHWQLSEPGSPKEQANVITANTVPGDSGSPVLHVNKKGEVEIVGLRLAIRNIIKNGSFGQPQSQLLPHLTIVSPGQVIRRIIREGTQQ